MFGCPDCFAVTHGLGIPGLWKKLSSREVFKLIWLFRTVHFLAWDPIRGLSGAEFLGLIMGFIPDVTSGCLMDLAIPTAQNHLVALVWKYLPPSMTLFENHVPTKQNIGLKMSKTSFSKLYYVHLPTIVTEVLYQWLTIRVDLYSGFSLFVLRPHATKTSIYYIVLHVENHVPKSFPVVWVCHVTSFFIISQVSHTFSIWNGQFQIGRQGALQRCGRVLRSAQGGASGIGSHGFLVKLLNTLW